MLLAAFMVAMGQTSEAPLDGKQWTRYTCDMFDNQDLAVLRQLLEVTHHELIAYKAMERLQDELTKGNHARPTRVISSCTSMTGVKMLSSTRHGLLDKKETTTIISTSYSFP